MAVYRDRRVPIPDITGITINRGDNNRVLYVLSAPYDNKVGYTRPKRITIGYVCEDDTTTMYPTNKYKTIFPAKWEKSFNETPLPIIKKMGMNVLGQAANMSCGIGDVVCEAFGNSAGKKMLDYALYSILYHSDVSSQFEARMSNQILYSGKAYSDSSYSDLFERGLTKDQILAFKKKWAMQCKKDGVDGVWLCIDGSNDDCESEGVELAEKGHAKSKRNVEIVSFTYAVTPGGKPVTFDVYRGGLVDAKEMQAIIDFLSECGIAVEGVILDRGYCNAKAIRFLDSKGIAYVIMVKGHPAGFERTVAEYGKKIKMNVEWLVEGTTLFGIQAKCRLFEEYEKDDYITLFYDFLNAGERIGKLLKNLYKSMNLAIENMKHGKKAVVDEKYKKLICLDEVNKTAHLAKAELQKVMNEKGLYSIVSSKEMTSAQVNALYASRNVSETQYMFIKSQLGYGKVRVHFTQGVHSRFALGFIASVIRYEIEDASSKSGHATNDLINEMNLLEMTNINGTYAYVHTENRRQLQLLENLGANSDLLDGVVCDENNRLNGRTVVPRHRKPGPKKKFKNVPNNNSERKKPGPQKGYRHGELNKDATPRKKPGPKPGTKLGAYNKDGSERKKPGPKPALTRKSEV